MRSDTPAQWNGADGDGKTSLDSRSQCPTGLKIEKRADMNPKQPRFLCAKGLVKHFWETTYIAATVAAFSNQASRYAGDEDARRLFGMTIAISRGAAQCLNLNCALILLPVSHSLVTRLVASALSPRELPPMRVIHAWLGAAILFWTVIHVGAHMCNLHRISVADKGSIYAPLVEKLFGATIPDDPWLRWKAVLFKTRAGITGIIMVLCMAVAYPLTFCRREHFKSFWFAHHLLIVMLVALCWHGTGNILEHPQSFYWIFGSLVLYLAPRFRRETHSNTSCLLGGHISQDGAVLRLLLKKPPNWNGSIHRAGMYAYLQIPDISKYEWHPFTITSCPDDPFLEFHIKKAGDWTNRLHGLVRRAYAFSRSELEDMVVKVNGPLAGSPTLPEVPVVVLIGAGMGVTPAVSILKNLLSLARKSPTSLQRVYLYWTVRTSQETDWFTENMNPVFTDASNSDLLWARYFFTQVNPVEPRHCISSTHEHTQTEVHCGRPHWKNELQRIQAELQSLNQSHCSLFVCGSEAMVKDVEEAMEAVSCGSSVQFHLAKEVF